jgi:hypothetical protein
MTDRKVTAKSINSGFSNNFSIYTSDMSGFCFPPTRPASALPQASSHMTAGSLQSAWARSLADYDKIVAFKFNTEEETEQAIDIFFDEPDIKGAPSRTAGNNTIFVPAKAQESLEFHFRKRHLKFAPQPVYRHGDLTSNELGLARFNRKLNY